MRRVLIVDDVRGDVEFVTKVLTEEGNSVQSASDVESALHRLKAWKPHLILLSGDLPKVSYEALIPKIRILTQDEYAAVSLLTSNVSLETIKKGMEAGADSIVTKPLRSYDLVASVRSILKVKEAHDSLRRANHRIEELISTDELTGLYNMRAAYRKAEDEIARSKKFRKPVSCLLINIDDFSSVNQGFGFLAGSHLLQEVGNRIKECLRSIDLAARIGADEFFVLLMDMDLSGAENIAEKVRNAIQLHPFKNDRRSINLTVTVGVAGLTQDQSNQRMSDLLHIASEALKSAKANGANRVEVYSFT